MDKDDGESVLFQGIHHGITISRPNEFEVQHRPSAFSHLPPLSAREVRKLK